MPWGTAHEPTPPTRADLTRELDVALHGEPTITALPPVVPADWQMLLAEVVTLRQERDLMLERQASATDILKAAIPGLFPEDTHGAR